MRAKRHAVRGGQLCSPKMPPKTLTQAELVAFFGRPFPGPGGAFKPLKYLSKNESKKIAVAEMKRKNCRHSAAAVTAVLEHSPKSPAPSPPSVADVAAKIAENQRMYRESEKLSLDSPDAANVASTPATKPKPKPVVAAKSAESEPDFLKNRDLHGLEPALSVRTRILLACHAMNRMNMSLDIAKSFAVAGYFPRIRCDNKCCV